jgi:hypothetical protein
MRLQAPRAAAPGLEPTTAEVSGPSGRGDPTYSSSTNTVPLSTVSPGAT